MPDYKGKVFELLNHLENIKPKTVLLATHNNPDPDALASAFGLRHLLLKRTKLRPVIGYGGFIGRAENQTMVRLLRLNPIPYQQLKNRKFGAIILCDTQFDSRNHIQFGIQKPLGVLDHHQTSKRRNRTAFDDIRTEYGASSTIVSEYLQEAQVPLDAAVATALFYGIKTDISDLARKKHDADLKALQWLYPKISVRWLYRIESPRLKPDYFLSLCGAIENASIHKDIVVTNHGNVHLADYIPELCDLLIKLEGMKWSFSIGYVDGALFFSLRTLQRGRNAGIVAQKIVRKYKGSGGGHNMSAGGRIEVIEPTPEKIQFLSQKIIHRFITLVGRDPEAGKPIRAKEKTGIFKTVDLPKTDPPVNP